MCGAATGSGIDNLQNRDILPHPGLQHIYAKIPHDTDRPLPSLRRPHTSHRSAHRHSRRVARDVADELSIPIPASDPRSPIHFSPSSDGAKVQRDESPHSDRCAAHQKTKKRPPPSPIRIDRGGHNSSNKQKKAMGTPVGPMHTQRKRENDLARERERERRVPLRRSDLALI